MTTITDDLRTLFALSAAITASTSEAATDELRIKREVVTAEVLRRCAA